jgi:hypothetical protein
MEKRDTHHNKQEVVMGCNLKCKDSPTGNCPECPHFDRAEYNSPENVLDREAHAVASEYPEMEVI